MKTVRIYEVGETVLVPAEIMGMLFENGEIKYKLKNPITGKDYQYLFTEDQLTQNSKEEHDAIKRRESH